MKVAALVFVASVAKWHARAFTTTTKRTAPLTAFHSAIGMMQVNGSNDHYRAVFD